MKVRFVDSINIDTVDISVRNAMYELPVYCKKK